MRKPKIEWTRGKIIETIKEFVKTNTPLTASYIKKNHWSLYEKSRSIFGSWRKAVEAAGFNYNDFINLTRTNWTKEKVLKRIWELHEEGQPLTSRNIKRTQGSLYPIAKKFFGSWSAAVEAAGIDYRKIRLTKDLSDYNAEYIIKRIQELVSRNEILTPTHMMKIEPTLYRRGKQVFGSWASAVEAAGIEYIRRPRKSRNWKWTRENIIQLIQEMNSKDEPLNYEIIQKTNNQLLWAARRIFGSWKAAIGAAGLDYENIKVRERGGYWTKEKVLAEIKKLHDGGSPLNAIFIDEHHKDLMRAATSLFGNWEKAITAFGLDYDDIILFERWSKQKVIDEIKAREQRGDSLQLSIVQDEYHALEHAARSFFGGWREALVAAGFNPYDIYVHFEEWSTERIIAEILELYEKGEDVSVITMLEEHPKLYGAASHPMYFGSYRKAVEAAGLDYFKIRKDIQLESYKGKIFEIYLKDMFEILGRNVEYHKVFDFDNERCIVDFYENGTGLWIDAKLTSHAPTVNRSINKYLDYTPKLLIIHLKGKSRKSNDPRLEFISVKSFYDELREKGGETLIEKMNYLAKGYLTPSQKGEFLRTLESFDADSCSEQ